MTLMVRDDGTYDYRYAPGFDDDRVVGVLREIADQIESGCAIRNSEVM